jgi:hypothetical protein
VKKPVPVPPEAFKGLTYKSFENFVIRLAGWVFDHQGALDKELIDCFGAQGGLRKGWIIQMDGTPLKKQFPRIGGIKMTGNENIVLVYKSEQSIISRNQNYYGLILPTLMTTLKPLAIALSGIVHIALRVALHPLLHVLSGLWTTPSKLLAAALLFASVIKSGSKKSGPKPPPSGSTLRNGGTIDSKTGKRIEGMSEAEVPIRRIADRLEIPEAHVRRYLHELRLSHPTGPRAPHKKGVGQKKHLGKRFLPRAA